ncbi:MAG: response regulator [Flavobacteriia bacterium]|nr:response regulator [Flavobacteriia bacterium]
MERYINILLIDNEKNRISGLREILHGGGNNLLFSEDISHALHLISSREVGIVILNINVFSKESIPFFEELNKIDHQKNLRTIILCEQNTNSNLIIKYLNLGAIDFIHFPFTPNLIKAKIEIYKSLYFKDLRIRQLLANIFPENVIELLNNNSKFSPRRINNGVVLFTDFVNFSLKAKKIDPLKLLKKLEGYFNKFDEITDRYHLEKIKTIGDSYMAISGVTETHAHPELRACLAALEIRNFMLNEQAIALTLGNEYWEIRIGIHSGPLVAGVIGNKKFSFDVWGDTVNISSRTEQAAPTNQIMVTKSIQKKVHDYFEMTFISNMDIKKRGGTIEMYQINRLKLECCVYGEGKVPKKEILKKCDLSGIDFDHMKKDILNRLRNRLQEELVYHDIHHTLSVDKSAIRLAHLEGIKGVELILLRTAVFFHDAGFLYNYEDNEKDAIRLVESILPFYGYEETEIDIISKLILSTSLNVKPKTLLEEIIIDADLDYLGRSDYFDLSNKLRQELEFQNKSYTDIEWIDCQIDFLTKHQYHTETARNIRQKGKENKIYELQLMKNNLCGN